jgi:hypothetical protein
MGADNNQVGFCKPGLLSHMVAEAARGFVNKDTVSIHPFFQCFSPIMHQQFFASHTHQWDDVVDVIHGGLKTGGVSEGIHHMQQL